MDTNVPSAPVTLSPEQEHDLRHRLQQGDTTALAALMRAYANRLARFATTITGHRDGAEDVVQHVFIQLWDHRATIDPSRSLKPYLYRSVRNRALDDRKADLVRTRYVAEHAVDSSQVEAGDTQDALPARVHDALRRLPERRQLVLRLRIQEGLSHAEVADVLGVSPMAAQRLFARAIADLREMLGVSD